MRRWEGSLRRLETLVIFRGPELNREAVEALMDQLPRLRVLGDLSSFDIRRPQNDLKRIYARIKDEGWDLRIIDSDVTPGTAAAAAAAAAGGPNQAAVDEKEFTKSLSLHWFYLTESPEASRTKAN